MHNLTYAALTATWCSWGVPPHNSIWGRHQCTTGATYAQTCILITLAVLCVQALRPTIKVYMHGRLRLTDYTVAASAASRLQCSVATCTFMPSRQPTKGPLTLHSSVICELMAGAHAFFGIGALLVDPLPLYPTAEFPFSKTEDYCCDTTYNPRTTAYN